MELLFFYIIKKNVIKIQLGNIFESFELDCQWLKKKKNTNLEISSFYKTPKVVPISGCGNSIFSLA